MSLHDDNHDPLTPWYAVPGYGKTGPTSDPHVVNCDGELVASFEDINDAELAANAVNKAHGVRLHGVSA